MTNPDHPDLSNHIALITAVDSREDDITHHVDDARLCALVGFVLVREGVVPMGVTLTFVDLDSMHALNREHMDTDRPTDVLAFPLDSPDQAAADPAHPHLLGDIVLAPHYIADQASRHSKSLEDEIAMLTVHGALHLLGYDHAEEEERKVMFALTDHLLTEWEAMAWTP
ncbi:rRNA maturation RNase YbeY [Stomatohabitans albus]|uniref:rRNA maturation RNase YbeY n=1 Tax=Stomatohabitans albus TaxID=3110766 RepID=UPI00300C3DE5